MTLVAVLERPIPIGRHPLLLCRNCRHAIVVGRAGPMEKQGVIVDCRLGHWLHLYSMRHVDRPAIGSEPRDKAEHCVDYTYSGDQYE